jgi:hypothetical protein
MGNTPEGIIPKAEEKEPKCVDVDWIHLNQKMSKYELLWTRQLNYSVHTKWEYFN